MATDTTVTTNWISSQSYENAQITYNEATLTYNSVTTPYNGIDPTSVNIFDSVKTDWD